MPLPGDAVHVFGVTSMPPLWLHAWKRASEVRTVHVYHLTPSEAYWGDARTASELRRQRGGAVAAEALRAQQNPLLTALGAIARDSIELLYELDPEDIDVEEGFSGAIAASSSALGWLHDDVAHARSSEEIRELQPQRALEPADDSVQIHPAHGPTRQVETLREALLELLDDHPDLEPRDIVVMTPDIATYAPLVQAVFHEGKTQAANLDWGPTGAPRLPTHIADLGLRAVNPLAEALLRVLQVATQRVTALEWMDFARLDVVQRRFRLSDAELDTVKRWWSEAGARWGLDADDRAASAEHLPRQHAYTFAFALDRLALGVARADDGEASFADTAPYDEMEEDAVATFGKVAEMLARLERWRRTLATPCTPIEWVQRLVELVDDFAEVTPTASFLRVDLGRGLDDVARESAGCAQPVHIAVIQAVLEDRFERPRSGDRPANSSITVCALTPMRSVPFRVVALLGMDDGAFPRSARPRSLDATADARRRGDRDTREEDRNLLLEALLAARGHFLVFYSGHHPSTGETRAPAVPVGDLLDTLDVTMSCPASSDGRPRDYLTRWHAVQPFLPSGFSGRTRGMARRIPARFDQRMRATAVRLGGPRAAATPFLDWDASLPDPKPPIAIGLATLTRWIRRPVRTLVRERLGLALGDRDRDELPEREPLALEGLESWALGDRLAGAWMRARPPQEPDEALYVKLESYARQRAWLPPGAPGRHIFGQTWSKLCTAWSITGDLAPRARCEVNVEVPGVTLTGGIDVHGDRIVDFGIDDPAKPRRLLPAWLRLLAARAGGHAHVGSAQIFGVRSRRPAVVVLDAPDNAEELLRDLLALHNEARGTVLRLFERTSYAYAEAYLEALRKHKDEPESLGLHAAAAEWHGNPKVPGEGDDPTLAAIADHRRPFEEGPEEVHPLFHAAALRLWQPVFTAQGEP
jgi:exodeoxyribonuclease V gamma subunit